MSETFKQQAQEFIAQNPSFHTGGFYDQDRSDHWDFDRIEKITEFIKNNYVPKKIKRGSYGLKHEIEDEKWIDQSNTYVANGECILAMVCAGYRPKHYGGGSPNCEFSVDTKHFVKLGEKKARQIWKGTIHGVHYRNAIQEEARLMEEPCWKSLLFREAYKKAKGERRTFKSHLCRYCLPPLNTEPSGRRCGWIATPFDQRPVEAVPFVRL